LNIVTLRAIPFTVPDHAVRYSITPTRLDPIGGDEHLDDRNIPGIDLKILGDRRRSWLNEVELNANQERIREPGLQLYLSVFGASDLFLVVSRPPAPKNSSIPKRAVHRRGKPH
jgi:hypothetical protein